MWPCMKLKHLQQLLQQIDDFDKPKILLEQYVTPSHLASHMLYTIQTHYGDIDGKIVADLGSGCGSLTIGAAALNAGLVIGFEIDEDAIEICDNNIKQQEFCNIDVIQCDIACDSFSSCWYKRFDTVIMNPPFGTKCNAGMDMNFLKKLFLFHRKQFIHYIKSSTRAHILKVANQHNIKANVIAELKYDLPSTYRFHKKSSVDIEVDFFRFEIDCGVI